jgi:DNA-binding transcriptional MerR regulator
MVMNRQALASRGQSQDGSGQRFYTIGDMAREFAVSLRALRFYEDRGLLTPHRQGTSRFYDAADRARLQTILKGKHLGFTLTEIREMLARNPQQDAGEVELALKPAQILAQIDHLERQRVDLESAILQLRDAHLKTFTRAEPVAG